MITEISESNHRISKINLIFFRISGMLSIWHFEGTLQDTTTDIGKIRKITRYFEIQ